MEGMDVVVGSIGLALEAAEGAEGVVIELCGVLGRALECAAGPWSCLHARKPQLHGVLVGAPVMAGDEEAGAAGLGEHAGGGGQLRACQAGATLRASAF